MKSKCCLCVTLFLLLDVCICDGMVTFAIGGIFHDGDLETEAMFKHGIFQANQELQYDLQFQSTPIRYGPKHRKSRDVDLQQSDYVIEPVMTDSQVPVNDEQNFDYYNQMPLNIKFLANNVTVSRFDSFKTGKLACEMTESSIGAIFGPDSLTSSGIVQSICTSMDIPHVQTNWNPAEIPYTSESVINLYPDPRTLSKALAALVKDTDWKSYVILYETDDALVRLQDVLKLAKRDHDPIVIRQLSEGTDRRSLLKEIEASKIANIILDCETDHILDILQQAKEVRMLLDYHNYIITSLDAHTLNYGTLLEHKPNITVMTLVDPYSQHVDNTVLDMETHSPRRRPQMRGKSLKLQAALTYDGITLFTKTIKLLYRGQGLSTDSFSCDEEPLRRWVHGLLIVENMKSAVIENGLTGVVQFDALGRRTNFTLHVLQISPTEFLNGKLTHEGFVSSRTEKEREEEIIQNINQKLFIVSSRIGRPYLSLKKPQEGLVGNDRYEGYSMDLIFHIAQLLNFSFEFRLAPDGKYGSFDKETKKWNGLIQQLLIREADLAICDLTITYDRRSAVDFTMPFMTLGISILYSKQAKAPPDLFSFTSPLSTDVWLYMATAFLGISFLMYILARMSPGDWENPHPCNQEPEELENIWNLKNCLWLTLGSIMAQGCDILPKGISTRMVTGMWWFFSLILLSSYTANLAAFLTMERMGPSIESAEDLAKQSKIKYGALLGGSTLEFFRSSNFSTYQRMWMAMESARPSVFPSNNQEGVERVLKGKRGYAFLMESTSIEYEVERNCELTQVGGLLDTKGYGIAMPVNSPYRTKISGAVLKLQEDGVLHQLKEKWWKEKHGGGSCSKESKASDQSSAELDLANVGGVFVVLFGGMGIAFLIAILEFLWNVRKVAVDEKLALYEAFILEVKFAMNVCVTKKAAKSKIAGSENGSETRSIAQSMIRSAGSFLNINLFNNEMKGAKQ